MLFLSPRDGLERSNDCRLQSPFQSPKMGSDYLAPVFQPRRRSSKVASLSGCENALLPLSQSPHLGEEDPGEGGWSKRRQKSGGKLSLGETGTRQSSQAAASICCSSAATVKPRLFSSLWTEHSKKGESRSQIQNGVHKTSRLLPSPPRWRSTVLRSSTTCPPLQCWVRGGHS